MLEKKIRNAAAFMVAALLMITGISGCGKTVYEVVASNYAAISDETVSSVSASAAAVTEQILDSDTELPATETIFVYVCGAVRNPGVIELPEGSRVFQAIAAAGGMTEEADVRQLNQAMVLKDGDMLTILTKDEAKNLPLSVLNESAGGPTGTSSQGKVNINTADLSELRTLSGIGEAKAADIISYRSENGAFQTIEDIMKVSGIKNSLFNRIKNQITVG